MLLEEVNVVATRAKLYLRVRHHQGYKARAVGERVREVCDRRLVLRQTYRVGHRTPVQGCDKRRLRPLYIGDAPHTALALHNDTR